MSKGKLDPVEAAKMVRGKKPALPENESVDVAPTPAPSPPAPAAAPAPTYSAPRWRVKKGKQVSIHGNITFLPEGSIVTVESYGPGCYSRLVEQGVELEAVE